MIAEFALVASDHSEVVFGQVRAGMLPSGLRAREVKVVALDRGVLGIAIHKEFVQRERSGGLSRAGGVADEQNVISGDLSQVRYQVAPHPIALSSSRTESLPHLTPR